MTDFDYAPEVAAAQPRLRDGDPAVRRIAVLQIADYAEEYPRLFVAAARDPDPGVRLEAARALEGNPDAAAVEALVDLLADPEEEVVDAAAESLAEILDPAAGPVLLKRLPAQMGQGRAAILAALKKLRQPQALVPALESLEDTRPSVRREAVGVLAYLKDPAALPALTHRASADPDPEVRRAAAGALSFAAADSVLPALAAALGDADWQVRQEAAVTLGKLLLPGSAAGLIAALADSAWEVRLKAAQALGRLQAAEAVPALAEALQHPVSNLRKEAAAALGAIGSEIARPVLTAALGDADVDVRKTAARALEALKPTA